VRTGRQVLLDAVSEEELARQLKRWALRGGWCGIHVRYSHAVVEGVHTLRNSDHSDAFGFPDWILARLGQPLVAAELKSQTGRVMPDQRRWHDLLASTTGVEPAIWRPRDEDAIKTRLLGGR
jgi:hypothetical protein